MNNDEKLREHLESDEVPEQLSPENIQAMLEARSAEIKRKKISVTGKLAATAAALVVVAGGYLGSVKLMGNSQKSFDNLAASNSNAPASDPLEAAENKDDVPKDDAPEFIPVHQSVNAPYMSSAESYEVIYSMMADAYERNKKDENIGYGEDLWYGSGFVGGGMGSDSDALPKDPIPTDEELNGTANKGDEPYSQTYNQEEGVLEADVTLTDGKRIYTLYNEQKYESYDEETDTVTPAVNRTLLRIASVDKGKFSDPVEVAVPIYSESEKLAAENSYPDGMYIYNDMLIIMTTEYYHGVDYNAITNSRSFVSFYTLEDVPQLIGHYAQDGSVEDVRISPEGYMYLITDYSAGSYDFENSCDPYDLSTYIPSCGCDGVDFLPADDILIPKELDSRHFMSYTIIGGIDLTVSAQFTPVETKALAGYGDVYDSNAIYCSADNLYTYVGWDTTDITRIALSKGHIEPAAACTIDGHINDQFSLSEYNGCLRVAANVSRWVYSDEEESISNITAKSEEYNLVYVLDMDMELVGQTERFGDRERIKSANFSGNMGYIVTYRETDPLFGIDLSDPKNPVITDEFKINGYSTYLQKWDDGLLFGFGANTDDDGLTIGYKLSMFDVSDPNDLNAVDTLSINDTRNYWIYSLALYERKALLIAPEKNIIGVPVEVNRYMGNSIYGYRFFSYSGGKFIELGQLGVEHGAAEINTRFPLFSRALYIGNYVYAVSGDCFISADIATLTEVDRVSFE